ncbi:N-acetyltransferase family protein [Dongia sp.]|uniref:GNAT family N-acetyltransferase n=1 Tax=Dongia sp. TaxID=1977262 RepID=UPI0035B4BE63
MQADQDRPTASIRIARAEDADGIARVHVESWRDAYAGLLPERHLLQLDPRRHIIGWTRTLARADDRRHTLVAIAEGEVVGFATFGPAREGRPTAEGEVYMLYVATDWREMGIGRQLVQAAFVALWETGSRAASIWCLAENHAAIGFYKRMGGQRIAAPREEYVGGAVFPVVGFRWELS